MKIILPINRLSETIYTDQRYIIDAKVLTEPRTFRVSKVNRISARGVVNLTFAQDAFDASTDYIEQDENGEVLYFWADYYKSGNISPTEEESIPLIRGEITTLGTKPQIRLGGGYKKLDVHFYEGDTEVDFEPGEWEFFVGEEEISNKLNILTTVDSDNVAINEIKIKLPNDNYINEDLLGTKINCEFHSLTDVTASYEISVVSL